LESGQRVADGQRRGSEGAGYWGCSSIFHRVNWRPARLCTNISLQLLVASGPFLAPIGWCIVLYPIALSASACRWLNFQGRLEPICNPTGLTLKRENFHRRNPKKRKLPPESFTSSEHFPWPGPLLCTNISLQLHVASGPFLAPIGWCIVLCPIALSASACRWLNFRGRLEPICNSELRVTS
jgi:hypothetical protein